MHRDNRLGVLSKHVEICHSQRPSWVLSQEQDEQITKCNAKSRLKLQTYFYRAIVSAIVDLEILFCFVLEMVILKRTRLKQQVEIRMVLIVMHTTKRQDEVIVLLFFVDGLCLSLCWFDPEYYFSLKAGFCMKITYLLC